MFVADLLATTARIRAEKSAGDAENFRLLGQLGHVRHRLKRAKKKNALMRVEMRRQRDVIRRLKAKRD